MGDLAIFIHKKLCDKLKGFRHLVQDSMEFMRLLSKVPCDPVDIFARYDVHVFFMAGESLELAQKCSSLFNGSQKEFILGASLFVASQPVCYMTLCSGSSLENCSRVRHGLTT